MRQLPPSAVPLTLADLQAGLRAAPDANEQFRTAIAAYLGVPLAACQLASSGRTVLYTLLKGLAAENPTRREVVIPAYTCPVVPKVALDLGLEPVYVDIDPQSTHYLDAPLAEQIHERTLAVFLVHPFGIPLAPDVILKAAGSAGAVVIEDAAQAMGARWAGQPVGLSGDYGLFSLGPGKPLSTAGGGIAVTGRHENGAALTAWWSELPPATGGDAAMALLRQALFQAAFQPRSWWVATRIGLQRLGNEAASWGYTVRGLTSSQSAVGVSLLPRLDRINSLRREHAQRLASAVRSSNSLTLLDVAPQAEPIYLRLPLLAASEAQREALYAELWAQGIGVGRLYERTLPEIFEPQRASQFPGAADFARRLLTLPTHYQLTGRNLQAMETILARY